MLLCYIAIASGIAKLDAFVHIKPNFFKNYIFDISK